MTQLMCHFNQGVVGMFPYVAVCCFGTMRLRNRLLAILHSLGPRCFARWQWVLVYDSQQREEHHLGLEHCALPCRVEGYRVAAAWWSQLPDW